LTWRKKWSTCQDATRASNAWVFLWAGRSMDDVIESYVLVSQEDDGLRVLTDLDDDELVEMLQDVISEMCGFPVH